MEISGVPDDATEIINSSSAKKESAKVNDEEILSDVSSMEIVETDGFNDVIDDGNAEFIVEDDVSDISISEILNSNIVIDEASSDDDDNVRDETKTKDDTVPDDILSDISSACSISVSEGRRYSSRNKASSKPSAADILAKNRSEKLFHKSNKIESSRSLESDNISEPKSFSEKSGSDSHRLSDKRLPAGILPLKGRKDEYRCTYCYCWLASTSCLEQHLNDRQHLKRVQHIPTIDGKSSSSSSSSSREKRRHDSSKESQKNATKGEAKVKESHDSKKAKLESKTENKESQKYAISAEKQQKDSSSNVKKQVSGKRQETTELKKDTSIAEARLKESSLGAKKAKLENEADNESLQKNYNKPQSKESTGTQKPTASGKMQEKKETVKVRNDDKKRKESSDNTKSLTSGKIGDSKEALKTEIAVDKKLKQTSDSMKKPVLENQKVDKNGKSASLPASKAKESSSDANKSRSENQKVDKNGKSASLPASKAKESSSDANKSRSVHRDHKELHRDCKESQHDKYHKEIERNKDSHKSRDHKELLKDRNNKDLQKERDDRDDLQKERNDQKESQKDTLKGKENSFKTNKPYTEKNQDYKDLKPKESSSVDENKTILGKRKGKEPQKDPTSYETKLEAHTPDPKKPKFENEENSREQMSASGLDPRVLRNLSDMAQPVLGIENISLSGSDGNWTYHCKLCSVACGSIDIRQHLLGKRHRTACRQQNQSNTEKSYAPQVFHQLENETQKIVPRLGNETQKIVPRPENEIQRIVQRPGNETQKIAPRPGNETQRIVPRSGNETQKIAARPGNETQRIVPRPGNETQRIVPRSGNEIQKIAPRPGNETQKIVPRPGNETQRIVPRPENETQKIAPRSWNETQKSKPRPGNETQKIAPRSWNETQKSKPRPGYETQKIAPRSWNETQKSKPRPGYDTQKIAPRPWNETQQIAPRPWNETQQIAPRPWNETQRIAPRHWNETQQIAPRPWNEMQKIAPRPNEDKTFRNEPSVSKSSFQNDRLADLKQARWNDCCNDFLKITMNKQDTFPRHDLEHSRTRSDEKIVGRFGEGNVHPEPSVSQNFHPSEHVAHHHFQQPQHSDNGLHFQEHRQPPHFQEHRFPPQFHDSGQSPHFQQSEFAEPQHFQHSKLPVPQQFQQSGFPGSSHYQEQGFSGSPQFQHHDLPHQENFEKDQKYRSRQLIVISPDDKLSSKSCKDMVDNRKPKPDVTVPSSDNSDVALNIINTMIQNYLKNELQKLPSQLQKILHESTKNEDYNRPTHVTTNTDAVEAKISDTHSNKSSSFPIQNKENRSRNISKRIRKDNIASSFDQHSYKNIENMETIPFLNTANNSPGRETNRFSNLDDASSLNQLSSDQRRNIDDTLSANKNQSNTDAVEDKIPDTRSNRSSSFPIRNKENRRRNISKRIRKGNIASSFDQHSYRNIENMETIPFLNSANDFSERETNRFSNLGDTSSLNQLSSDHRRNIDDTFSANKNQSNTDAVEDKFSDTHSNRSSSFPIRNKENRKRNISKRIRKDNIASSFDQHSYRNIENMETIPFLNSANDSPERETNRFSNLDDISSLNQLSSDQRRNIDDTLSANKNQSNTDAVEAKISDTPSSRSSSFPIRNKENRSRNISKKIRKDNIASSFDEHSYKNIENMETIPFLNSTNDSPERETNRFSNLDDTSSLNQLSSDQRRNIADTLSANISQCMNYENDDNEVASSESKTNNCFEQFMRSWIEHTVAVPTQVTTNVSSNIKGNTINRNSDRESTNETSNQISPNLSNIDHAELGRQVAVLLGKYSSNLSENIGNFFLGKSLGNSTILPNSDNSIINSSMNIRAGNLDTTQYPGDHVTDTTNRGDCSTDVAHHTREYPVDCMNREVNSHNAAQYSRDNTVNVMNRGANPPDAVQYSRDHGASSVRDENYLRRLPDSWNGNSLRNRPNDSSNECQYYWMRESRDGIQRTHSDSMADNYRERNRNASETRERESNTLSNRRRRGRLPFSSAHRLSFLDLLNQHRNDPIFNTGFRGSNTYSRRQNY